MQFNAIFQQAKTETNSIMNTQKLRRLNRTLADQIEKLFLVSLLEIVLMLYTHTVGRFGGTCIVFQIAL